MSRILKQLLKHGAIRIEVDGTLTPTPNRRAPKPTTAVYHDRQLLLADQDGVTVYAQNQSAQKSDSDPVRASRFVPVGLRPDLFSTQPPHSGKEN